MSTKEPQGLNGLFPFPGCGILRNENHMTAAMIEISEHWFTNEELSKCINVIREEKR